MNKNVNEISMNLINELNDCILYGWNPCYHAANWKHLCARMISQCVLDLKNDSFENKQKEMIQVLSGMKPKVEKWLLYYKSHSDDGFYDAWIEKFWLDDIPDKETENYYFMHRMYEKYLSANTIEIYDYSYSADKDVFLEKWNLKYNIPYQENDEKTLYIGQKGKLGNFYEGISDFFEPQTSPEESDWWKLVSQVIKDE